MQLTLKSSKPQTSLARNQSIRKEKDTVPFLNEVFSISSFLSSMEAGYLVTNRLEKVEHFAQRHEKRSKSRGVEAISRSEANSRGYVLLHLF